MGMDVIGKNPENKVGEYFRRNCWGWRPLWMMCEKIAPDICLKVELPQTNDGDGLDSEDSKLLAQKIIDSIKTESAQIFIAEYNHEVSCLPNEDCGFCESGITTQKIANMYPAYQQHVGKTCIQCKGKGYRPNFMSYYSVNINDLQEFAEFLKYCGGFEIW